MMSCTIKNDVLIIITNFIFFKKKEKNKTESSSDFNRHHKSDIVFQNPSIIGYELTFKNLDKLY